MEETKPLNTVDAQRRAGYIIDAYVRQFAARFQQRPLISDEDKNAARSLAQKWNGGKEAIIELIDGYFDLNDDWVKQRGFSLKLLEANFNAVMANRPQISSGKKLFVVALSESGYPVVSHNPQGLTPGFQVVNWDEWERTHGTGERGEG